MRNFLSAKTENNGSGIPVVQQLGVALGTLLLIFGTTYISDIIRFFVPEKDVSNKAEAVEVMPEPSEAEARNYFEDIDVVARSAYVWDVKNQKALFNKNADEQLPLASITKLMTALVAYELMGSDSTIDITIDAVRQDGDSGLNDGETFSFYDLTDLMLVTSSNDGAYALASAAGALLTETNNSTGTFVKAMNMRAGEIGLSQTYFNNPTGLDISETKGGAYGSARDVAFLMEYIISNHPSVVELTKVDSLSIPNENGEKHLAANTNSAMENINGLIASKTGYTDLAGGNLVIAFNAGLNRPIIVSVLGSTFQDRFDDAALLAKQAQEYALTNN